MDAVAHLDWPAPAKLNRFLHITGQRDDGYHLLQTVFQFLDYNDTLDFQLREDSTIRLMTELPGVDEDNNLVVRAARLLQQHTEVKTGVEISLHKCLPMGGGLGGGSSNAATVLVALNTLWGTNLKQSELASLGLQLGADVPVFIHGQSVWAEGVGEQFKPINLDEPWFLVIIPPINVSTAEVFAHPQLTRNTSPITIPDFKQGAGKNDCEALVEIFYPAVKEVLNWLRKQADCLPGCVAKTRMTGTGACVFTGFQTKEVAMQVYEQLPENWQAFVAKGLNISPLHQKLQQVCNENT